MHAAQNVCVLAGTLTDRLDDLADQITFRHAPAAELGGLRDVPEVIQLEHHVAHLAVAGNFVSQPLAGLLFVPQGEGPSPAAVIIHGSGTSRRDNRWYLTLTQYLSRIRLLLE